MSQKRNRSINWDEEEKQLFRSVLKDYAQIIEKKSLDTNTNKLKTKAWEEVHKTFNNLNKRPRELSQLKIQWKGMKVNARKTYSSFKKEANKTGGGERPATPDEAVIEIRDLLNPAELLRDHNPYDSDGLVIGELELPTPSEILDNHKQYSEQATSDNTFISNPENEHIQQQNATMETFKDINEAVQECSSLVMPQENGNKSNKNSPPIPSQTCEDDLVIVTPMKKTIGATPAKKLAKRKLMAHITDSGKKPRMDHEDYINKMFIHSKMLKDKEHMRIMEMAEKDERRKEEEHEIKMEIHKEKLKAAILERKILEIKIGSDTLENNK